MGPLPPTPMEIKIHNNEYDSYEYYDENYREDTHENYPEIHYYNNEVTRTIQSNITKKHLITHK